MKKRDKIEIAVKILGVVVLVAFLSFYLREEELESEVCFGESCVDVEVVSTPEDKSRGLMFREYLEEDEGMLFVFEESGVYPFWMKNTLIPLDIIWISSEGVVVHIDNAVPCEADPCVVYDPGVEALHALEVNSGWAARNGVVIGSLADF